MLLKYTFFFMSFLLSSHVFSQAETYEYLGVIKLNDSAFIPYKLAFEELNGKIEGFSVADLGGKHETKSNIIGSFNSDNKTFTFKEYDIVYTKSSIAELDMCLVNFEGKMRNLDRSKAFSGNFKGYYPDASPCLNGMIIMSASAQVKERIEKMDRKIQKSKIVNQDLKDKISAKRIVDTLTMSIVKKDENLNVFTKTNKVILSIYDSGKVDNDRINLYVDDVLILADYSIEKAKKHIPIAITKTTTVVRVEAIDEGTSAPNTVKVEIQDGPNLITTRTSLKTGEKAELSLIKQ